MIPIPGTKRRRYLELNVQAVDVSLDEGEIRAIEAVIDKYPNTGDRYPSSALKQVSG
jgi:aryl-alcohol dehydrogenase-like predicted oxidoreductase